jgi:hypothetical protein
MQSENPWLTWIGGTTPVLTEGLSSTESQQEVEIQFDSRYALRRRRWSLRVVKFMDEQFQRNFQHRF